MATLNMSSATYPKTLNPYRVTILEAFLQLKSLLPRASRYSHRALPMGAK